MTKAKRADEILGAALYWQNGRPRGYCPSGSGYSEFEWRISEYICDALSVEETAELRVPFKEHATLLASAALSEVAGMGYDLETVE